MVFLESYIVLGQVDWQGGLGVLPCSTWSRLDAVPVIGWWSMISIGHPAEVGGHEPAWVRRIW